MINTRWNKWFITLLRVVIGWHFLYEGLTKLWAGNWTATGYLSNATGPFAGFYHWLGASEGLMSIVDPINIALLILVGLGLFLGFAIRWAAIGGIALLALYYFAYPPFGGSSIAPSEMTLFIVNKNFIEACALVALMLIRDKGYGLYALKNLGFAKKEAETEATEESTHNANARREALKNLATLPVLGIMGWGGNRKYKVHGSDTMSGATIQIGEVDISELKGELPKGKLGKHNLSRLILGGNLIGGWAHSRDLIYVPSLFKAYNTKEKVFETLNLAEQAGINAINIGFVTNELIKEYRDITGGKMTTISQVHPDMENNDYTVNIDKAIDLGSEIIQVQGNWCDWLVRDGKLDVIEKMISHIRSQGMEAGLGAHTGDSLIACEEAGIIPDYYMKTFHHDQYWSAHPKDQRYPFEVDGKKHLDHNRFHDNLFCLYPEKSIEFVQRATVPVMGFKVLAAGAIKAEDGFNWAFQNGCDFICVGMFDFQIVKDVNITIDVLNNLENRNREWFA